MQPSEYDIQREVEALRDIRRRSTTPGALTIDPDLPNQSSPTSPTAGYWSGGPSPSLTDDDSSSAYDDGSSSELSGGSPNNPADDPFHLFWVPAGLHPEIAPAEFRAFLKEHARSPPTDGVTTPERSNSVASASSGLGRKKSMLSRQYRPSENDGIEDERVVPLRRNRSSVYSNLGPQLTINDLQKLEELAEEASESDDPSKLRNVLRRSLSLNVSPSDIGQADDMSDMGDEADAPIIVPPPGQILRRAARTKIRKPGLPGDGGGHRFASTRRGATARPTGATSPSTSEPRPTSDVSSSDHDDPVESVRPRTFSNGSLNPRPDSFSEEASIYDAYARDDDEDMQTSVLGTSPPPITVDLPVSPPPPEAQAPPALLEVLEALGPILHHPQPQRLLTPPDHQEPARTPSPPEVSLTPSNDGYGLSSSPPSFLSSPPNQVHQRKDRDKKGLFGKWGGDKGGKKTAKEKERENRERAEKEKESGFFVSLFGSKKKQEDPPPTLGVQGGTSGREAAQALLGASKSSKSAATSPTPQFSGVGNSYARYPIHVERAIYRLSHIKLANPRRPLYEQVLISNLMFWYLGVINKAQTPGSPPSGAAAGAGAAAGGQANSQALEKEQKEKEQKEKEQKEKLEKERSEKERAEREREIEMKKRESRRGSLTKTAVGAPAGGRRAEMPVKGPQYEMQHRVMEQEYGGFNGQPQGAPMGRSISASAGGGGPQQYPRMQQPPPQFQNQPKFAQAQAQPGQFYYESDRQIQPQQQVSPPLQMSPPLHMSPPLPMTQPLPMTPPPQMQQQQIPSRSPPHPQQQRNLPPGAMPPIDKSTWLSQPPPPSPQRKHTSTSPPPLVVPSGGSPHRRSRSPPPPQFINQQPLSPNRYNPNVVQDNSMMSGGSNRIPGRSLSATAAQAQSPPLANGKLRKGTSAHAVSVAPSGKRPKTSEGHHNGIGEEEDMPLAVWQQQRRR